MDRAVSDREYRLLLTFRTQLRRFLRWSEECARDEGLTAAQHQLLLVVRASATPGGPSIGEAAEELLVRHHTVVGLVDRCESHGWIRRAPDRVDHRVIRLALTRQAHACLDRLSSAHLDELARLRALLPQPGGS